LTTVIIVATDTDASETWPDTGAFTIIRMESNVSPLTVLYSITGSAQTGNDYTTLSGSVNIPAGSWSATVTVTPIDDTDFEDDETVIATISPDANYTVGSPDSATVNIADNDTRYVMADATGANDGTSWTNAFTDLQSALAVAVSGQEIWVAAGTYKPTSGTDRAISFVMIEGVGIYGGFAGTESACSQRDWTANVTALSGDIGVSGDNSDNSYHVIVGANNAVLDGFTVRDGMADGADSLNYGGGMYNSSSNPTVTNCTFSGNSAFDVSGSGYGGGMYNIDSSPTVTNCMFIGNSGTNVGGGMCNWGASSSPTVTNCAFSGNWAHRGGGMYNGNPSNSTVTNCTFSGNSADHGGGMHNEPSSLTVTNCIIWGNTASYAGEASIFNNNGATPVVTYSCIEGGYAGTGNIAVNPGFVNASDPDGPDGIWGTSDDGFMLQSGSLCIDAGSNSAVPAGITTDFAGNPRFVDDTSTDDTGEGSPPIVDMGAYEYQQP
jgi:hypothetical protein